MRRFTLMHPMFMSFYSRELYLDVGRNWMGAGLVYLLLLLSLCLIPGVLRLQADLSGFLNDEAPGIARQVPEITISKGTASIEEPEPYVITDPKSGRPLMVIDTTGKTKSLQDSGASVLLNKTTLFIKKSDTATEVMDLSEIDKLVIDRSLVYDWIETLDTWAAAFIYPFALLFSFLYHGIEVLVFASIGVVFTRSFKVSLDFRTLSRLAAVSLSPFLILEAAFGTAGFSVPYWWLIRIPGSLGYLYFAVKSNTVTASLSN